MQIAEYNKSLSFIYLENIGPILCGWSKSNSNQVIRMAED